MPKPILAKISATGIAVPPKILTNQDLEEMVETSNDWIVERTGIHKRHIAAQGVTTSDLCTQAAKDALAKSDIAASDIDMIIVATITPDMILPATACLVQHRIGAHNAWGFDLSAACSGFVYALEIAIQFIASGSHKNVLVLGVDIMSSIIDYQDRQTCIIFGDGGGAVLVQPTKKEEDGCFIDFFNIVDGAGGDYLCIPGGGSKHPTSHETINKRMHYVKQDGPVVFKFATKKMAEISQTLLERNGLTGKDIDLFIPHQANKRIIDAAAERLQLPKEKVIINIDEYGNTTAGTIPLAIHSALDQKRLKKGDLVLMTSMGAGFTAGSILLRWG